MKRHIIYTRQTQGGAKHMTLFSIFIGISVAVIGLVVYSALVVSSRQERIAQRVREENRFERAAYSKRTPGSLYSAGSFAFETAEELTDEDEFNETDELSEFDGNYF